MTSQQGEQIIKLLIVLILVTVVGINILSLESPGVRSTLVLLSTPIAFWLIVKAIK